MFFGGSGGGAATSMTVEASLALSILIYLIYSDVNPRAKTTVRGVRASSPPVGKLLLSGDSECCLESPHASAGTTVMTKK